MSRRDYIPKDVQIAALLLTVMVEEDGKLVPFIDHDTAKQLTPAQIISLFHRDHYPVRKVDGGPDAHWNLVFRPIMEHRIKTAKVDRPAIAKSDRLSDAQEEFRRKMLAKAGQETPLMQAIKDGRIKVTRSSFQTNRNGRFKKKMNGTVERRD
jgi:hypothetical protein